MCSSSAFLLMGHAFRGSPLTKPLIQLSGEPVSPLTDEQPYNPHQSRENAETRNPAAARVPLRDKTSLAMHVVPRNAVATVISVPGMPIGVLLRGVLGVVVGVCLPVVSLVWVCRVCLLGVYAPCVYVVCV